MKSSQDNNIIDESRRTLPVGMLPMCDMSAAGVRPLMVFRAVCAAEAWLDTRARHRSPLR